MVGSDNSDTLEFYIWFMPNKGVTASTMNLNIQIGLCVYVSDAENLDLTADGYDDGEIDDGIMYPTDTIIPISPTQSVMLGDVKRDNRIDINDAYKTLELLNYNNSLVSAGKSGYKKGIIPVNNLNSYFDSNKDSWNTKYGSLEYAEIADVDFDGNITDTDKQMILEYSSWKALGQVDLNSSIGNVIYVNVRA